MIRTLLLAFIPLFVAVDVVAVVLVYLGMGMRLAEAARRRLVLEATMEHRNHFRAVSSIGLRFMSCSGGEGAGAAQSPVLCSEEVSMPPQRKPWFMRETRRFWPLMTINERFEHLVAFVLGFIVALVVALALVQLLVRVVPLLLTGALDPLDHEVFQSLFGMVMTLLIAMEFNHSIVRVALRHDGIVQVKTVVLIALLALSRKFVVLDTKSTEPTTIAALAGATLVLGIVYWLLRERDDRLESPDAHEDIGAREHERPDPPA